MKFKPTIKDLPASQRTGLKFTSKFDVNAKYEPELGSINSKQDAVFAPTLAEEFALGTSKVTRIWERLSEEQKAKAIERNKRKFKYDELSYNNKGRRQ